MYRLPLFDHRVLDLTEGEAGFAGRLLGDMGAEVIRLDGARGGDEQSGTQFQAINANKHSCTGDASDTALLMRLAERLDVLVAEAGTVDVRALRAANDAMIVVLLPRGAGVIECIAAAGAVGLALWDRRRTGKGGEIELDAMGGVKAVDAGDPRMETVSTLDGVAAVPGSAWRMSETPPHVRLPAPRPGQHDEFVHEHLLA